MERRNYQAPLPRTQFQYLGTRRQQNEGSSCQSGDAALIPDGSDFKATIKVTDCTDPKPPEPKKTVDKKTEDKKTEPKKTSDKKTSDKKNEPKKDDRTIADKTAAFSHWWTWSSEIPWPSQSTYLFLIKI